MDRNKRLGEELTRLAEALRLAMQTDFLSIPLSSDMDAEAVQRSLLGRSLLKKFSGVRSSEAASRAISKFLDFNARCSQFSLVPTHLFDDELIGEVRDILDDWLHPFGVPLTCEDFLTEARPGKKASLGCVEIDFYTKLFDSPLTATSDGLRVLYRTYISRNPTWLAAEKARETRHGSRNVRGSKTSTVPKQYDIDRTICTEPTLNMFFQLGIGLELRRILLSREGLDLRDQQEFNAELARLGSIDQSFGTIDLASASDSISTRLCHELLPPYFVRWLERTRSPVTILPDGREVELGMISSMGNGFTFPLQTMIFTAIVKAAYRLLGLPFFVRRRKIKDREGRIVRSPITAGVFGDDIIVRREAYDYIVARLPLFGFVVNADKSFNTGSFRESCGKDYWAGTLVRGIYLEDLETDAHCYSAINRLVRWGWRCGVDVGPLVSVLWRRLKRKLLIPPRDGDSEGVHVPAALSTGLFLLDSGFGTYRALVEESKAWRFTTITRRHLRLANDFGRKVRDQKLAEGDVVRCLRVGRQVKILPVNWDGLLVAGIGGYYADNRFLVRSENKRLKVRQRQVPFWDYAPKAVGVNLRGESWQAFALRNLVEVVQQET